MSSPYDDLPATAFWRTAVADQPPLNSEGLYQPKFLLRRDARIFTAGSCFAQHIGRALRGAGFKVLDVEPAPTSVSDDVAMRFGYRLFSARFGNIYTVRQLIQLMREAYGEITLEDPVWRKGDTYVDSQRPAVEPDGLPTHEAVLAHRARHLACIRRAVEAADLFIFTFGLTEAWRYRSSGEVFPTAPGTIAGAFSPSLYKPHNFSVAETVADFAAFRDLVRRYRPDARFLVTVSPVPLTATASGKHVQIASSQSKAILRAACSELTDQFEDIDYFPSYEIITSPTTHGAYFEANKRTVTAQGIAAAMDAFLKAHAPTSPPVRKAAPSHDAPCEDVLLDAFAPKGHGA